ncbi:MAG: hypothetical protein V7647_2199 [Acidobacteriota bacterium]
MKRLARIPGDAYARAAAAQDNFREFRESIPRLAKFMAEIERGATPQAAAKVTRQELVDYTRLTDFERVWLRGAMMPFYTSFKKNAENWLPGLRAGADGSRATGVLENAGRIGKVMLPAYMVALYNEKFFPDAEHTLSENDRNRLHVLVPWKQGVMYLGFTGPANAAAGLVGLQGFTQRSLDLVRGRTTIGEEAERRGQQIRNNVLGLLSPATEGFEQLTNTDLRTGYPIVPPYENFTAGERAQRRLEHVAGRFAPVSQITQAAGESTGTAEGAAALVRHLVTGSLVKPLDLDRNRAIAMDRAIAQGQRDADEAHATERRADVHDYADRFIKMGVEPVNALIDGSWDGVDRSERAVIVAALKEANRQDRRFGTLLAHWRSEHRSVSDRQEPYVQEELQRKGLIPVAPR